MKNILIVAAREFRQIASMRSFWLTLLILPVALCAWPDRARFLRDDEPDRVIDHRPHRRRRSALDRAALRRTTTTATCSQKLSRYVQRHKLETGRPGRALGAARPLVRRRRRRRASALRAALDAALAKIDRVKPADAPTFKPPTRRLRVRAGAARARRHARRRGSTRRVKRLPQARRRQGAKPVDYVLLVPRDFGPSPLVRLWARGEARADLYRSGAGRPDPRPAHALSRIPGRVSAAAQTASAIAPALAISTPPPGGGAREAMLVRSILPLAATYLLMMSLMLSGSWMLQGTVEERSNKLLETVLACISPEELMYGKLLGTIAVGLSMILAWVACGVAAGYATHGVIADLIRPALDPLTSPGTIFALIYFFLAGYVTISVLFLAIGGMSNSMREAQGYLMPVLLAILMPITLLLQAILAGKRRYARRGPDLGAAMDSIRGARAARHRHSDLGGRWQRPRARRLYRDLAGPGWAVVPGEPARPGSTSELARSRRPGCGTAGARSNKRNFLGIYAGADFRLKARARGRSSAGRASQWHCEGQGFDPPRLHQPSLLQLRLASQPRMTEQRRLPAEALANAGATTPKT